MGTLPSGINIARINIEIGGAGDKLGRVVAIEPGVVHFRQVGKINSINRLPERQLGNLGVPKIRPLTLAPVAFTRVSNMDRVACAWRHS